MLGQTQLLDPPPTKTLCVPEGHVNWYGVDPSTKRVAIATVTPDGLRGSDIISFPKLAGAHRLAAIRHETFMLARSLAGLLPPGVIVCEAPAGFGDRPNPELAYAAGAIMCALAEAAPGAAVELVVGSSWKKAVCGYGGIKKPKPTDRKPYAVLTWAQEHGYDGSSWDVADAMAIAEYARLTYALR